MRRILLVLLLLPTILSTKKAYEFNLDDCHASALFPTEFMCLVPDWCIGKPKSKGMGTVEKGFTAYQTMCDVHMMVKQYNMSSYFIRFITTSNMIKVTHDGKTLYGCELTELNDKELSLIDSELPDIQLKLISPKRLFNKKMMICEISVVIAEDKKPTKDLKIVHRPDNSKEVTLKLTLEDYNKISRQFKFATHRCDPSIIQLGGSNFAEGGYSVLPVVAHTGNGNCSTDGNEYTMAYENKDGKVVEVESIICDLEERKCVPKDEDEDGKDNEPTTCEWRYFAIPKGGKEEDRKETPKEFYAACRKKICEMCSSPDYVKCDSDKCKTPNYKDDKPGCHSYACEGSEEGGESIVEVDGGKRTIGKFECTLDQNEKTKDDTKPPKVFWTFNAKKFTTASCFKEFDCSVSSPLNIRCTAEDKKNDACPKKDISKYNFTCPDGWELELIESTDKIIKPLRVECKTKKGFYTYTTADGEHSLQNDTSKYQVVCSKKESEAAQAGFPTWAMFLGIGIFVLVVIVIILICLFLFFSRRRKAEEERKALLKKNENAPSSTDSGKPQPSVPRQVQLQPVSTARQISSEQISEATAVEKTKKELQEKTMIEPTLDLATAYSHDKSRQSKRETGSVDMEYMDDKHSDEHIPEPSATVRSKFTESAVSSAVPSKVAKKDGKADQVKPRQFELNEKEKKIAKGVWRKNDDYPTMADIESDWDDAKDGKPPSKQRTATKDLPTADTPSVKGKGATLNEKTAEMERLLEQSQSERKLQRVSEDPAPAASRGSDSRASRRTTNNKFPTMMSTLDATQDQKF